MKPTIKAAQQACEAMGARQVVLVAIDASGRFAVVSYGQTKAECAQVKSLCDDIAEALNAGVLRGPTHP